jgi:hypothetical protein
VSLQLIVVGTRHCRVLYIIPVQPELILVIISYAYFLVRAGGLGLCRSGFNRLAIKISNQRTTTINPDFSTCDEDGGI